MKITRTDIIDLIIIEPDVFHDSRGYFYESYNRKRFDAEMLDFSFVQDNVSKSVKGTVRGLHYQVGNNVQGKLCQVLYGKVLDVAVDIRFGSPDYGKYVQVELSDENNRQFWIPPGFAHGFSVLSETAVFYYKCTAHYSKQDERTILYNDDDLRIDWKVDNPSVSVKDLAGVRFKDIQKDFIYK